MQKTQQKKRKTSSQLTELEATWLPDVEAIQRDFRRNRPRNRPAVLDIYDVQFAILQNYTADILNQQFFAYDNGVSMFCTDKGFYFTRNSQDWFLDGTFKSSPVQIM